MLLKPGVVVLAPGTTQGNAASIVGNINLRNYMTAIGLIELEKVFRRFNPEDTIMQLEDGEIVKVPDLSLVFRFVFPVQTNIGIVIDSLEHYPDVIYAGFDHICFPLFTPDDDSFPAQWALNQGDDPDIDADLAWDIETGNYNINIGIIDQGVDYWHADLGQTMGAGHKVAGGYDYVDNDNDPRPTVPNLEIHGTHVAGIPGALTNNNTIGIAGLSGGTGGTDIGCALYSYRVASPSGHANASDVAEAIVDAALHGIQVMNVSLGSYKYNEALREAVCLAYKTKRTFVAARGNDGTNTIAYPACFDYHWIISVGATNSQDQKWSYSSIGQGIDVVAPGVDILSTIPVFTQGGERYYRLDGTSMAAPHVAGLAALLRSRAWEKGIHHALEPEDVQGVIRVTAKDLGDPGYDDNYGDGRINAYDALRYYNYNESLRRFTVNPSSCTFTGTYYKRFIDVQDLNGRYLVQRFGFYRDVYLPDDTLKFLGIWGLGRPTSGYSDADPNYGEGYCGVQKLPGGDYQIWTYFFRVWAINEWGQPIQYLGWYPLEPDHPQTPTNVDLVYRVFSIRFFKPYNLRAEDITTNSLTLRWNYVYPDLIDGFTVKRDGQVIGNPSNTQLHWYDSGLEPGHLYHYEVMARKGSIHSSPATLDVSTIPTEMLAQSYYPKMSAFNSNRKVVRSSDGKIHVLYNDDQDVYYSYSSDNGNTFEDWEILPELGGTYQCFDTIPALQLDGSGTPWVVSSVHYFPNQTDKWLEYYLHKRTAQGWFMSYDEIWQKKYLGSQPLDILHPASFAVAEDSGFIAFRDKDLHTTVSSFPLYLNTDYTAIPISGYDPYSSGYPAIGSDSAGRIVVIKKNDPLQIFWRSLGSSTWTEVTGIPSHIGCDGNPSLWVDNNEINIVFEGWYTGATGYEEGLVFLRFTWSSGSNNYVMRQLQPVTTETDWSSNGMEGYSYLASRDIVLWKYQDDVWYSRQSGDVWTEAVNVSNTSYSSTYPQGLTFWQGLTKRRLFVMWTEIVGDVCYLMRKIITVPPADPDKTQGVESQFAGPFSLEDIQQNPIRRFLKMKFSSPDERIVRIEIYDVTGRFVKTAFDGKAQIGENEVRINKESLPAGIYFVRTEAEDYQDTRKIVFLH